MVNRKIIFLIYDLIIKRLKKKFKLDDQTKSNFMTEHNDSKIIRKCIINLSWTKFIYYMKII